MKQAEINRAVKIYNRLYDMHYKRYSGMEPKKRQREAQEVATGCLYQNHLPGFGTLTQRDIAEISGLPVNTASYRIHSFNEKLEDCLDFARLANKYWHRIREDMPL